MSLMSSLALSVTILFTSAYRDKFDMPWREHKALMINERVYDEQYTFGPTSIKTWTDLFVLDKRPCKQIESMAQFDDLSTESCYLIIDKTL